MLLKRSDKEIVIDHVSVFIDFMSKLLRPILLSSCQQVSILEEISLASVSSMFYNVHVWKQPGSRKVTCPSYIPIWMIQISLDQTRDRDRRGLFPAISSVCIPQDVCATTVNKQDVPNTTNSLDISPMLGQRRRRWTNIESKSSRGKANTGKHQGSGNPSTSSIDPEAKNAVTNDCPCHARLSIGSWSIRSCVGLNDPHHDIMILCRLIIILGVCTVAPWWYTITMCEINESCCI